MYVDTYDVLNLKLRDELSRHPIFGPIIAATPEETLAASSRESRAHLLQALAGDWGPYEERLRRDGATYAKLGLDYRDWYRVVSRWSLHMVPLMVERFGAEPARLSNALNAMNDFLGTAMCALGESYIMAYAAEVKRKEEEALARSRELAQWETVFLRVPWGIAITTPSVTEIATANPAFRRMYGIADDEVSGFSLERLYAEGRSDRTLRDHQATAGAGYFTFESMHRRVDGSPFPVRVEGARIPNADGVDVWALGVHDLTERDQLLALRAHSLELELENRRIQEASRMKTEFLANMSHELRTPLNSILGFSGLLVDGAVGPLEEKQREFIGDIHRSGKHLLRLINDLLDLSKVEAGKMEFHPEAVDLAAPTAEVIGVLRGIAIEKEIEPTVEIDPAIGSVHVDASRLKQVLYNFLSNAYKFSPPRGRVTVRVRDEGSSFRVAVRDEGPGIAPRDLERLFQQFEQLEGGLSKTHGGTGLGLALTRGLVEAQGGTVGVDSTVGAGSEFHAVLPKHAGTRSSLPQPRRIPGPTSYSPRVLVIEDDAEDQERIVNALVGAGYAVDTAATGAQGLRAYQEGRYAAITLDLLLPDTSGLDVLTRLRATRAGNEVPVIVISVVTERATGGMLVHDALSKPLEPEILVESLARAGVVVRGSGPILVVDDDEGSARLMVASLERAGFSSRVALDGEQGLALAEAEPPSAVVLDLVMPNLDGFGFLERFRAAPKWDHVPVFIWSVQDLDHARYAELLRGAEAVLPKNGAGARDLVDILRRRVPPTDEPGAR